MADQQAGAGRSSMFKSLLLGVFGATLLAQPLQAARRPPSSGRDRPGWAGRSATASLAFKGVRCRRARGRPALAAAAGARPGAGVRPARPSAGLPAGPDRRRPGPRHGPQRGLPVPQHLAPPKPHRTKLPVLVWIYGGGLVNGGTQPAIYQGDRFARQGLVFVSLSYRLGRFGFFGLPRSRPSTGELKGNYAYMDQIAASSGSSATSPRSAATRPTSPCSADPPAEFSVHTLLASPARQRAVQRAIVGIRRRPIHWAARPSSADAPACPSAEPSASRSPSPKASKAATPPRWRLRALPARQDHRRPQHAPS